MSEPFQSFPAPSLGGQFANFTGYNPYGGFGSSSFGYGLGSEQLWGGFLGKTAETLCRLNNLLSMTGMLLEHLSSHSNLLYSKSQELVSLADRAKGWFKDDWKWKLGFALPPSRRVRREELDLDPGALSDNLALDAEESFEELLAERNKRRLQSVASLIGLICLLILLVRRQRKLGNFARVFRQVGGV